MSTEKPGLSDSNRKAMHWVVLVLSILLFVFSLGNVITGTDGFWPWAGVICWPIVAASAAYNLKNWGADGPPTRGSASR